MDEIRNDYLIGNYLLKDYKINKELGEGAFGKVYIIKIPQHMNILQLN